MKSSVALIPGLLGLFLLVAWAAPAAGAVPTLKPDSRVEGRIEGPGWSADLRLPLKRDRQYAVTVAGVADLADPEIVLLDPVGAVVASNDDSESGMSLDSMLTHTASRSGDYTLRVRDRDMTRTGTFSATLVDNGKLELKKTKVGETETGVIETPGQMVHYEIRLEDGERYAFRLASLEGIDPLLRLYGTDGDLLAMNDDSPMGLNSSIDFLALETGTYRLAAGGSGVSVGRFVLVVDEGEEIEAVRVEVPGSPIGAVAPPQEAWFKATLEAGQAYVIRASGCSGDNPVEPCLDDPQLTLYSPSLVAIEYNDDHPSMPGLDSRIDFTPESTAEYFLSVKSVSGNPGRFLLSVEVP